MDNTLSVIGLALRAGRLEAGDEPAGEACRLRRCRLLLTASDAGESSLRRARRFAEEGQCLLAELPYTKAELGAALGRGSCAIAAVTDLGLARAVAGKLAAAEPGRYGQLSERLAVKAERAARRKEKNAAIRGQRGQMNPSLPGRGSRKKQKR